MRKDTASRRQGAHLVIQGRQSMRILPRCFNKPGCWLAMGWVSLCLCSPLAAQEKTVFGYLERVVISTAGLALDAKLDTGADTSSLHAENIKRFKRMGDRFVRFQVRDDEGELVTLERPLSRMVRIRRHDGDYQKRPVVKMWICIGMSKRRVEVNLIDRSQFSYPFLLGRSAMEGSIIVDPDKSFSIQPDCELKGMDQ